MRRRAIAKGIVGLLIRMLVLPAAATELKLEAVRGFEQYVQLTERQIQGDLGPGGTFLWVNTLPQARRQEAAARLRLGQVVIERMEDREAASSISTPGAMIHHWVGTVLIPGATLAQVLRTIQDYDRHQEYYAPEVVKSRMLEHSGSDFRIYLRLKREKVITVEFNTEHEIHYQYLDTDRAYSESRSRRMAELKDPGEAGERELPAGEEHGFLWRLNSYWRFSESREGVYVQCEAVSLTRDIPTGLGWLVGRFVESIPKESLGLTLQSTRTAVLREISLVSPRTEGGALAPPKQTVSVAANTNQPTYGGNPWPAMQGCCKAVR